MAITFTTVKIDARRARPVRGAATGGTFRELAPDEIERTVADLYARHGLDRPGRVTRPAAFTRRYFEHAVKLDENQFVVVHTNADGVDDGYLHYATKWAELPDGTAHGTGEAIEVIATDAPTELALWRYLFDIDLVTEWSTDERPTDDLVPYALGDRRAYKVVDVADEAWVSLVDVDAALAARSYQPVDAAVVIEVADPWVAANNARWRVSSAGAERVDSAVPDLIAPVEALGAAYLGGTPWWALVGSGRATATHPTATAAADALFVSIPGPVCGSFF